ncbi:MAG: hypothetical protein FWF91_00940 [Coriobacteriia bacterium]|nr:hypothetical protein [Coriobacteriia bacterium]
MRKNPLPQNADILVFARPEEPPKSPTLKLIFDRYEEETITDEQVQRVLAPILLKIWAGEI